MDVSTGRGTFKIAQLSAILCLNKRDKGAIIYGYTEINELPREIWHTTEEIYIAQFFTFGKTDVAKLVQYM